MPRGHRRKGTVRSPDAPRPAELFLRPGSNLCRCEACGEHFKSPSTFEMHQVVNTDGSISCYEPESIGLINKDGWWSRPPDEKFTAFIEKVTKKDGATTARTDES